jgi:hypothetical protein
VKRSTWQSGPAIMRRWHSRSACWARCCSGAGERFPTT